MFIHGSDDKGAQLPRTVAYNNKMMVYVLRALHNKGAVATVRTVASFSTR